MSTSMSPQLNQGGLGLRAINNRRNMDGPIGQSYNGGIPTNGQISAINPNIGKMGVKAPIISTIGDNRAVIRANSHKPNWWG